MMFDYFDIAQIKLKISFRKYQKILRNVKQLLLYFKTLHTILSIIITNEYKNENTNEMSVLKN